MPPGGESINHRSHSVQFLHVEKHCLKRQAMRDNLGTAVDLTCPLFLISGTSKLLLAPIFSCGTGKSCVLTVIGAIFTGLMKSACFV